MPVYGDGGDAQTDHDIMANDVSYGTEFFDHNMANYDMGDGSEFLFDSDNSPLPMDAFDEPASPTDSPRHPPLRSSSRNSVVDSGRSSEGKQSTAATGFTVADAPVENGLGLKQEWPTGRIQHHFGDNMQSDAFYTAANSPAHGDSSFSAALDLSPSMTTNMQDLDLTFQTTNMQSLELRNRPGYSQPMDMQALAPDAMLQSSVNAFAFGAANSFTPSFSFGPSTSSATLGASPESNPFSPGTIHTQPSPLGPSPGTHHFDGLPAPPYPSLWAQMPVPKFEEGQGGPAPPFSTAMPVQLPAQPRFGGRSPYGTGPYNLQIWDAGEKSRVETQIPIVLVMDHLPPGIRRLHLPTHAVAKYKLIAKPTPEPAPDMLELHTSVVCTSAVLKQHQLDAARERAEKASRAIRSKPTIPSGDSGEDVLKPQDGGEVYICNGCISRERKRSARKKNIKRQDDEEVWKEDEKYRVLVFNTHEIQDWMPPKSPIDESGQLQSVDGRRDGVWWIKAPMRITCYCRHHTEKMGFRVIFTLTDYQGKFVAQSVTETIMITDDHKTPHQVASSNPVSNPSLVQMGNGLPGPPLGNGPDFNGAAQNLEHNANSQSMPGPMNQLQHSRNHSRSASPSDYPTERTKMRKTSDTAKMAVGPPMASLDAAMYGGHQAPVGSPLGIVTPPAASAFPPTPPQCPDMSAFVPGARPADRSRAPYSSKPPTPGHYQRSSFTHLNGTAPGLDHTNSDLYSGLASVNQSRAPSPSNTVVNTNAINPRHNPVLAVRTQADMHFSPALTNAGAVAIHKLVPCEGSVMGGIDVTILGQNFQHGMEVMFGDVKAVTTTFWGETTLVCLVPPAKGPGRVQVTIKDHEPPAPGPLQWFTYTDDVEVQLMRTALAVLNGKLSGNFHDVVSFANRINSQYGNQMQQQNSSSSGNNSSGGGTRYNRANDGGLESHLLGVLEMIDLDDSPRQARFNLRRRTGQTMMHLACHMGLRRFVAGLLARGANPDARDRGGYTPLHLAALKGHSEIVASLIAHKADPTLRTLSGVTPLDVASSEAVRKAISRYGLHSRSRSAASLHSRGNSIKDIKIQRLTDLLANVADSGEESPEYSTFASSSEVESSEGEQQDWLEMQRKGSSKTPLLEDIPVRRPRRATDLVGGLGLPATAMTAFKDHMAAQLQQLQQSMQLHLPNLPQFPQLPQLPQIAQLAQLPQFPYLPQMPNMPNLPPSIKERDWWFFLSSLAYSNVQTPQAPPAYNEIFPHDGNNSNINDKKRASAAQAAADAVADAKCASLYDQAESSSAAVGVERVNLANVVVKAEKSETVEIGEEPPALLQIGRKNAITQEQQENFLRARAAKLKDMSWDKNLFLIWIPVLVLVCSLWFYHHFGFSTVAQTVVSPIRGFVLGEVL